MYEYFINVTESIIIKYWEFWGTEFQRRKFNYTHGNIYAFTIYGTVQSGQFRERWKILTIGDILKAPKSQCRTSPRARRQNRRISAIASVE